MSLKQSENGKTNYGNPLIPQQCLWFRIMGLTLWKNTVLKVRYLTSQKSK